jgi:hypothetical protein
MTYPAIGTMAKASALLIQNPAPPVANQKPAVFSYKIPDTFYEQWSRSKNEIREHGSHNYFFLKKKSSFESTVSVELCLHGLRC